MHQRTQPSRTQSSQAQPARTRPSQEPVSQQRTGRAGGAGQRSGEAGQQTGGGRAEPRQTGLALRDVETPQQRAAVDDVARAVQVCEWCADQCIQLADPGMVECIRRCRDVSRLGGTAVALLARNSPAAQSVLGALERAIQACGQECGRHPHAHCQECAQVLGQADQSIRQLLESYGGRGSQPATA